MMERIAAFVPLLVLLTVVPLITAAIVTPSMKVLPFRKVFLVCLWGTVRGVLVLLAFYITAIVAGLGRHGVPGLVILVVVALMVWLIRMDLRSAKLKQMRAGSSAP